MRTLSDMPRSKWGAFPPKRLEILRAYCSPPGAEPDLPRIARPCVSAFAPWRYATLSKAVNKSRNRRRDLVQKVQTEVDAAFNRIGMKVRLAGREKRCTRFTKNAPQAPELCPGDGHLRLSRHRAHHHGLLYRTRCFAPDVQACPRQSSRITSPLPNSMATSLCTPRWWGHLESTSSSRCARTRCM